MDSGKRIIACSLSLIFWLSLSVASPTPKADVIFRDEILDANGLYRVQWKYVPDEKIVEFEITAETTGYVGFGLSPVGGMTGADIVIGGVHPNETAYFSDRHGVGTSLPLIDSEQNWFLLEASENQTHTYLKFNRSLDTCDEDDVAIGNGTVNFIWSMGGSDEISYHGSNRGTYAVNILDPPMPPFDTSLFKSWNMMVDTAMPSVHTTYWCTVHKSPTLISKHHIVGFRPSFGSPEALKHTHHMIVHSCHPPEGSTADEAFAEYIGKDGAECYTSSPLIPEKLCQSFLFVWAVGGKMVIYPEHIGYPFAEDGLSNYYMLETHYNNPENAAGLKFDTGLELFYTSSLRTYDAGTLTAGHETQWTLTVPHTSSNFMIIGHCAPDCSNNIPADGISVFNVLLHSHISGRKLKIRHFRNNEELPWLASDENYSFDYQQNRPLIQEVKVMPGDHLIYECTYDTHWKNASVIGGLSTEEEMCMTFISYYPRIPLHICSSEMPKARLMSGLGIESWIEGDNPTITAPDSMAGMKYTEVLDNVIPWTPAQRTKLQEELRYGSHLSVCAIESVSGKLEFLHTKKRENQIFVTYPVVDDEYAPPNQCLKK